MPTYAYVAMNSSGQEVKEEVDANSSEEAIAKIRSKGYFPTKVKEKAADAKVVVANSHRVSEISPQFVRRCLQRGKAIAERGERLRTLFAYRPGETFLYRRERLNTRRSGYLRLLVPNLGVATGGATAQNERGTKRHQHHTHSCGHQLAAK